jgi:hypothetical protein
MRVECDKCHLCYDDADFSTICPHPPVGVAEEDWCREHDLIRWYQPAAFEALGCPKHANRQI